MPEQEQAVTAERSHRKVREGLVVSDKMVSTVVVLVREQKPHPLYKKVVRHTTRPGAETPWRYEPLLPGQPRPSLPGR